MIPNNIMNIISRIGRISPNMMELQKIQTPDEMAQFLLNTGKVNQSQVNQAKQMWENPQIRQQINNRYN